MMSLMPLLFLVSSGFLQWVSSLLDNSELQLTPGIKSHIFWYQAMVLLFLHLWPLNSKTNSFKVIQQYLDSEFPLNQIISISVLLIKTSQILSDFQTSIGIAANATAEVECLFLITEL